MDFGADMHKDLNLESPYSWTDDPGYYFNFESSIPPNVGDLPGELSSSPGPTSMVTSASDSQQQHAYTSSIPTSQPSSTITLSRIEQHHILRAAFMREHHPSPETIEALAQTLQWLPEEVSSWFSDIQDIVQGTGGMLNPTGYKLSRKRPRSVTSLEMSQTSHEGRPKRAGQKGGTEISPRLNQQLESAVQPRWECVDCPSTRSGIYTTRKALIDHETTHFPKRAIRCDRCEKPHWISKRSNAIKHFKDCFKDEDGPRLKEAVHNRTFSTKKYLFHDRCGFANCEASFKSRRSSVQHIHEHLERGDGRAQWSHCCRTLHWYRKPKSVFGPVAIGEIEAEESDVDLDSVDERDSAGEDSDEDGAGGGPAPGSDSQNGYKGGHSSKERKDRDPRNNFEKPPVEPKSSGPTDGTVNERPLSLRCRDAARRVQVSVPFQRGDEQVQVMILLVSKTDEEMDSIYQHLQTGTFTMAHKTSAPPGKSALALAPTLGFLHLPQLNRSYERLFFVPLMKHLMSSWLPMSLNTKAFASGISLVLDEIHRVTGMSISIDQIRIVKLIARRFIMDKLIQRDLRSQHFHVDMKPPAARLPLPDLNGETILTCQDVGHDINTEAVTRESRLECKELPEGPPRNLFPITSKLDSGSMISSFLMTRYLDDRVKDQLHLILGVRTRGFRGAPLSHLARTVDVSIIEIENQSNTSPQAKQRFPCRDALIGSDFHDRMSTELEWDERYVKEPLEVGAWV